MVIKNIATNKAFFIHNSVKNYSCYNVFNQKDINTFDVLTFIQVSMNKNKFIQTKNGQVRIYFGK